MKKWLFLLLVLPVWAGCNIKFDFQLNSRTFSHTGCAKDQTKGSSDGRDVSLLILKYEGGDLRVTRTNAFMNCSIKTGGIACEVSLEDNVIHYKVYEKDGPSANCICPVEEMTSVVTGLEKGKEYTMDYFCSGYYTPFTFVFNDSLYLIQDADALLPVFTAEAAKL